MSARQERETEEVSSQVDPAAHLCVHQESPAQQGLQPVRWSGNIFSNNEICFQVVTWQDEKEGTFRITREGHFEILSNAQL